MSCFNCLNIFGHLTKDKREEKNLWTSLGRNSVLNIHYMAGGALMTNFMHERGITPEMQAPYDIPGTFIVSPLLTLLVMPLVDRVQNRIRAFAWTTFVGSIGVFLPPLIFCLGPEKFRTVTFILVTRMLVGWLACAPSNARLGLDGAVNCRIMHNSIRGRYTSISGMAQGILGIGTGLVVTWLAKSFDIRTALLVASVISVAAAAVSSLMTFLYTELPDLVGVPPAARPKSSFINDLKKIFTMKEFKIMMPANLLRGVGDGVGVFIFWIALKRLELPPVYAGYVTLAGTCAPFLGNLILGLTMDRFGAVIMIPASCIVIAASLMGTILTQSPALFLGFYFIYLVAKPIEASAVPLAHYEVVPNEVMGAFTTVRLALLNYSTGVASVLAGLLMRRFTPTTIFVGSAALKLVSGTLFCIGLILLKKHKEAQA